MSLAKNISIAREQKGLSIEDIARKCNVTCAKVIDWEAGDLEPTIKELTLLSYVLGVTMDALVKENNIIQAKEKHYLTESDYRDISMMMIHANRFDEINYLHPMGRILVLKKLVELMKYRFIDEEGAVYDEFLVENTDKETRQDYVKKYFSMFDGKEIYEEYVEGKIEIDEAIKARLDYLKEEFAKATARVDFIHDSNESKPIYELNTIYDLEEIEDYSEKKINEIKTDLSEYIENRIGNTLIDKILLVCANEAAEALEVRDLDRINELIKDWDMIKNTLFMMLPQPEKNQ